MPRVDAGKFAIEGACAKPISDITETAARWESVGMSPDRAMGSTMRSSAPGANASTRAGLFSEFAWDGEPRLENWLVYYSGLRMTTWII